MLPSGRQTTIASIDTYDGPLQEAFPTLSVMIRLADEVDVSRGDMIVGSEDPPGVDQGVRREHLLDER